MSKFSKILCVRSIVVACAYAAATTSIGATPVFSVSQAQPEVRDGGRMVALAMDPLNDNHVLVGAEGGGLFMSGDGGTTWRHVDAFPNITVNGVAFMHSDSRVVIATTPDDSKTANGGGIWISRDGGSSWNEHHSPCPGSHGAYDISVAPDSFVTFVTTDCGLSLNTDPVSRERVWVDVPGPNPPGTGVVQSVLALEQGQVLVGSVGGGLWYGRMGPAAGDPIAWHQPWPYTGRVTYPHRLSADPTSSSGAFVMNDFNEMFRIVAPPLSQPASMGRIEQFDNVRAAQLPLNNGGCGGTGYLRVVAAGPPGEVDVHASEGCEPYRIHIPRRADGYFDYIRMTPSPPAFSPNEHMDFSDIAFNRAGQPYLLAGDGGVARSTNADGSDWRLTGGGSGGLDALQGTGIAGQQNIATNTLHLFFTTQHTSNYALIGSVVQGEAPAEGWGPQAQRYAIDADLTGDSALQEVSLVTCWDCKNMRSDVSFHHNYYWLGSPQRSTLAPPSGQPTPTLIAPRSIYVQPVYSGASWTPSFQPGLAITDTDGREWLQAGIFLGNQLDLAKISRLAHDPSKIVLYQTVQTGTDGAGKPVYKLVRIDGALAFVGGHPAAHLGFTRFVHMEDFGGSGRIGPNTGGIGVTATAFGFFGAFAVDPSDADRLIAEDVYGRDMKISRDGGDSWQTIPGLEQLVTHDGALQPTLPDPSRQPLHPQASTVSFCADASEHVAIGTWEGGVFYSSDRGEHWVHVPDSDQITSVTSVFWLPGCQGLYVASYGRGLWRIDIANRISRLDLDNVCVTCLLALLSGSNGSTGSPDSGSMDSMGSGNTHYDAGFAVENGEILDVRQGTAGRLIVTVTPGSAWKMNGDNTAELGIDVEFGNKLGDFPALPGLHLKPDTRASAGGFLGALASVAGGVSIDGGKSGGKGGSGGNAGGFGLGVVLGGLASATQGGDTGAQGVKVSGLVFKDGKLAGAIRCKTPPSFSGPPDRNLTHQTVDVRDDTVPFEGQPYITLSHVDRTGNIATLKPGVPIDVHGTGFRNSPQGLELTVDGVDFAPVMTDANGEFETSVKLGDLKQGAHVIGIGGPASRLANALSQRHPLASADFMVRHIDRD